MYVCNTTDKECGRKDKKKQKYSNFDALFVHTNQWLHSSHIHFKIHVYVLVEEKRSIYHLLAYLLVTFHLTESTHMCVCEHG